MAVRKKYRVLPEINMGPFADIAFLLIIFFILATSLVKPMGRLMDVPSAAAENKEAKDRRDPTVSMLADQIHYGRDEDNLRQVTPDELRSELIGLNLPQKPEPERMVVVNTAEDVPFENFYRVVTAISKAGGIVTLIEEQEETP